MTAPEFVGGCTGKKRFIRYSHARRAARRRNRHDSAHLEAYHCRHCAGFHVGESPRYGRRDARREHQTEADDVAA